MISDTVKNIISPCLWDTDIESFDVEANKFLIIERILEHGSDKQIEFIMTNYKPEDVIHVVKESSYLSRKTVNYWCLFFNLKKGDTRCFTKQYHHLWPHS